ncbi:ribonuclease T2 [uncultured Roseovarius sp.]|uniref:ribonuclease T2 n=1 Tax=uncultured Roseovarius sp. TaxID=293344 RepID=UPI00261A4956|nr:ribonuclease T2 [uncultured Roseovarius sp.]
MKDQRMRLVLLTCLALFSLPAAAQTHRAGVFDYYVLALSWSPTWCALEGDARHAAQCESSADTGWVLHGLWPQYHRGWPQDCTSAHAPPTRGMTRAMADIMGNAGLAWHQWNKHGVCSGLPAAGYYALSRAAYDRLNRPDVFRKLSKPVRLPAKVVEDAFLKANPGLEPDMLTITCRAGRIQEARLCLSRDLAPVPCGADVVRDCSLRDALFDPIR